MSEKMLKDASRGRYRASVELQKIYADLGKDEVESNED